MHPLQEIMGLNFTRSQKTDNSIYKIIDILTPLPTKNAYVNICGYIKYYDANNKTKEIIIKKDPLILQCMFIDYVSEYIKNDQKKSLNIRNTNTTKETTRLMLSFGSIDYYSKKQSECYNIPDSKNMTYHSKILRISFNYKYNIVNHFIPDCPSFKIFGEKYFIDYHDYGNYWITIDNRGINSNKSKEINIFTRKPLLKGNVIPYEKLKFVNIDK